MAGRTGLRMALIKCGTCGQRYSNPLGHVCRPRSTKRRGRTKLAPQISLSCPNCGKPYANPLTHVCRKRSDFKKRKKAAAARERKTQREANRHEYAECDDPHCNRFPCKVYREGYDRGYEDGHQAGYSAGYDAGFAAGQDAAKE